MCVEVNLGENGVILHGSTQNLICDNEWFLENYQSKIESQPDFIDWWKTYHGQPENRNDWSNMAYALQGWIAWNEHSVKTVNSSIQIGSDTYRCERRFFEIKK